jgi:hypothetical protein
MWRGLKQPYGRFQCQRSWIRDGQAISVSRTIYAHTMFRLDSRVDISDTIEIKLRALASHGSQMTFLTNFSGQPCTDVVENVRICAAYPGGFSQAQIMLKHSSWSTKAARNSGFSIPTIGLILNHSLADLATALRYRMLVDLIVCKC